MKKQLQFALLACSVIGAVFSIALLYYQLSGRWSEAEQPFTSRARQVQRVEALLRDWEHMPAEQRTAALPELAQVWQLGEERLYWEATLAFAEAGTAAVPFLGEALRSSEEQVRQYAAWSLGILGPEAQAAWQEVRERLHDASPGVRAKAAFALGRLTTDADKAVPALIALFADADEEVGQAACHAVSRFGAAAVPELRQTLHNSDLITCRRAVLTLGELGPEAKAAVPDLIALLCDAARGLQEETMETLARIGPAALQALAAAWPQEPSAAVRKGIILNLPRAGPLALPLLIQVLHDPDASVRLQAVTSLGQMGSEARSPVLTALRDPEAEIRQEAARVLGILGCTDGEVVSALVTAFRDPIDRVRGQAVMALRALAPEPATVLKNFQPLLTDQRLEVRLDALRFLGELGPAAVPHLVASLKDPEMRIRQQAIRTLEDIRAPANVLYPALLPLLQEEDATTRQHAVNILWRCDTLAVPHLIEALRDSEPSVRLAALYGLYQVKADSQQVLPAFVQALEDEQASVRAGAAAALGRFGVQALSPLRKALQDKDAGVRQRAALALGQLPAPAEVLPVLQEALRDEAVEVRLAVVSSLGRGGMPAVPLLLQAFKDPDAKVWLHTKDTLLHMPVSNKLLRPLLLAALKDPDSAVRQGAAYTMSRFAEDGVQPLVELLQQPDQSVHWAAVDTLDTIGPPARPSFPVLVQTALNHPQAKIRQGAVVALLTIHLGFLTGARQELRKDPTKAVPTLMETLHGKNLQIRWEAAEILGVLGPAAQPAVPALQKALDDRDPRVRQSAGWALQRIQP